MRLASRHNLAAQVTDLVQRSIPFVLELNHLTIWHGL
jgi:hypothetical protein